MTMKKIIFAFALVAAIPAGMAMADDDDCSVPRAQWQSHAAVEQLAAQNGWSLRKIEVDDGCYEIYVRDRDGRAMEVELHPATLQVLEIEYDDDDNQANMDTGTGIGTPPQNGLFENGTVPQVTLN
jgi:hypothetical protein